MIHCSACGATNPDGNRFCSQCGEPLQPAGLRCPMCGAMNPAGNVQCEKCDARLTPLIAQPQEPPPITPSKEERAQPVEAEGEVAGDWLTQLRTPTAEEEVFEEPEAEEEVAGDWLTQLRAPTTEEEILEEPEAEEEAAGDWLSQLRAPTTEEEILEEPEAAEVAEDWLSQLRTPTTEEEILEEPEAGEEIAEDWLPQLRTPTTEEEVFEGPEAEVAEDWLTQLRTPAEEEIFEEPETEEEVTGDWLSQLRAPAVEEPEGIAEPIEPTELPDWLQEAKAPLAESAPESAEVPDWLREMAPPAPEAAPEELFPAEPAPESEVPDWLREMAPPAPEAAPEEAFPEDAAPEPEVPDWLREMPLSDAPSAEPIEFPSPIAEAAPEEAFPEEPESGLAEVPDWLREMEPLDVEPAEAPPPAVEVAPEELPPRSGVGPYGTAPTEPAPEPEIPDWLREMPPPDAQDAETAGEALFTELAPEPAEIPDWLQELGPPKEEVPIILPLPTELAEGLAHAEIPGWLEALRPRPVADEAAIEEEAEETEGLLKGLRGLLSPASAIEALPIHARTLPAESSEASLARAQLLQGLLIQPAEEPQLEVHKRRVRISELAQRLLVLAALLVVVGVLLAPWMMSNVPTLTKPAEFPEANGRIGFQRLRSMHDTIQGVNAGDTVLVAFEYGPAEADELNLVAEPILRHLLDQGAQISAVSTRPEGLTTAAGLLSDIVESRGQYTETQYSISDNYRSGGATGVSQLLAEAGARPRLLLVLTAQPAPLRWWIEQTHARPGTLPIVAGVSAILESAISPYLDASAEQLDGAVHGLSGAAAYEKLYGSKGRATQQLDALAVGHIATVGLMIIGALLHTLGGLRGREK
jgi:hypothetical protein